MENTGQQIIEQLRQKVQQQAQRKSEKIKAMNSSTEDPPKENEYQKQPASTNIFSNFKKPETVKLFGGQRKSVNIFQIKPPSQCGLQKGGQGAQNIFNQIQKPTVVCDNENDEDESKSCSEHEAAIQGSQNRFKTEPEVKVMKYEYKNQLIKVCQMPIRKFKNGISNAKQQIYVSLEKLENQPSTLYMLIRSNTTKVLVYQGIIMKNISKLEHFMNKLDNIKFDVLKKNNSQQNKDQKLVKQTVRIQFLDPEQCQQFKKVIDEYFSSINA